ncbi:uncharacterized protein CELE_Y81G3A.2 [Caenorhabditis elegans]|uniref:Conserved domain protein n=1 Tax=Caenorhabditis elegans TaxID=6239 RepID=D6VPA9_CAEEL|nr:uncharacterized protein CELE_Y81G3A.2 [Caenorhabditis elegans]CBM41248.2 Conserved domain protein [Caenorhabditis elegans]
MFTLYSTLAIFEISTMIFGLSLYSFLKNRRLRQFKLSELQVNGILIDVHKYYKDRDVKPKLNRKVLEVMDPGRSILKSVKNRKNQE